MLSRWTEAVTSFFTAPQQHCRRSSALPPQKLSEGKDHMRLSNANKPASSWLKHGQKKCSRGRNESQLTSKFPQIVRSRRRISIQVSGIDTRFYQINQREGFDCKAYIPLDRWTSWERRWDVVFFQCLSSQMFFGESLTSKFRICRNWVKIVMTSSSKWAVTCYPMGWSNTAALGCPYLLLFWVLLHQRRSWGILASLPYGEVDHGFQ